MTTLPQTTALRLPRPSSAAQISIPGAPGAVGFANAQPAIPTMTGADAWRVIRSNMWLIILLLIVSGVGGYGLNYWLALYHAKYSATAMVEINPPQSMDPLHRTQEAGTDLSTLAVEQKTQAQLLRTQSLFSEVLQDENSPIRNTKWIKQFASPAMAERDLDENLAVTPSMDTRLIRVDMSARDGADCKAIIESIVEQHRKDQENANKDVQLRRSNTLTTMRERFEQERVDKSEDLNDKQTKLNISGPGGSARLNIKDGEMSQLIRMRMDAELKLENAEDHFNRLGAQVKAGQDPAVVSDAIGRDPDVQRYRTMLSNIEIDRMTMGDSFGDKNTTVQKLKAENDVFTAKLKEAESDVRKSAIATAMDDSQHEVESAKFALGQINQQIQACDSSISELNKSLSDYLVERDELTGIDAKLALINDQLEQIANYTNQKDLTNITWVSHPEATDIPTFPRLPVTMATSIMAGLALSLGIAFARELMDTTVRSPRDISRVGNMNLLGMIPHEDDDPQSQGARLPLVIFEAPQSMMAEQLRQVRTRLQHAASLDTTRSILVTSPSPDDGKSTIAANLASGLALNGRRILLVDANFRRPSLHRTFNVGNDRGFSDVLNSIDAFESTIQETQVPNLYVLPSGLKPTNATELLESQLLIDFIERALEEFDHVIFDSGPLLFVSETVALAPRVDGVVTVVRARTNSRGVLQRMRDSLRQVKAEHLGVVLNAVRSQGGGYYRSNIRTYYDYQNGRAA